MSVVDHPELTQFRRTDDVDVIVAVVTYIQFAHLEEKLRANGFVRDTYVGAPICRWIIDGCRVNIMPAEPANLGMNTRWFPEALKLAIEKDLGEGCAAKVVSPALFLATKLEAFKDRAKGDYYMSHDLEYIITLVDGCAAIVDDVKAIQPNVKESVVNGIKEILRHPDFRDALPGHMVERQRIPLVMERFNSLCELVPG